MSEPILFFNYLVDLIAASRVTPDELKHELNCKTDVPVRSWLEGRSRPPISVLPTIAAALKADPVEMAVGWTIDQCPELEEVLRAEVLDPRGSKFPRSTDLALRMPKPVKRVTW